MANWLIWQIDCGESAYGKKAYGKTTVFFVWGKISNPPEQLETCSMK